MLQDMRYHVPPTIGRRVVQTTLAAITWIGLAVAMLLFAGMALWFIATISWLFYSQTPVLSDFIDTVPSNPDAESAVYALYAALGLASAAWCTDALLYRSPVRSKTVVVDKTVKQTATGAIEHILVLSITTRAGIKLLIDEPVGSYTWEHAELGGRYRHPVKL